MKSLSLTRPHALIMVGIPGSGKTQFARQFAETFNAPYVDIRTIAENAKDDDSTQDLTSYVVGELMKTGQSVVIDAYADSRQVRTELGKYCRQKGYTPLFIWVQTEPETAKRRATRQNSHDVDEFDRRVRHFSAPHPSENALVISGKHTYATQARVVLKRLSAPRAEAASATSAKAPPLRPGHIKVR